MVSLACAAGRTDGRTCNDIVLTRHDLKTYFEEYFREFEKPYMYMYGLQLACVRRGTDGHADGRIDTRTDGHVTTLC